MNENRFKLLLRTYGIENLNNIRIVNRQLTVLTGSTGFYNITEKRIIKVLTRVLSLL